MKLKFLPKWILLLCFVALQNSDVSAQFATNEIFDVNYLGINNVPSLYVSGNDNSMSIREQFDFKFSASKNINSLGSNRNDLIALPISSIYYEPNWGGTVSNFTIGYSPLPHLYTTANVMMTNEKETRGWYNSKAVIGDIGIGTYFLKKTKDIPILKNKFKKISKYKMSNEGLLVNALIGYSRGNILKSAIYKFGEGEFILNRIYGKIGVDYQSGFFGVASNVKLGILNYGKTTLRGHATEDFTLETALLTDKNNFLFTEFSVRGYVGMKYGQIYINGVITKVDSEFQDFVLTDLWSVGAVLDIQDVFKKKDKE